MEQRSASGGPAERTVTWLVPEVNLGNVLLWRVLSWQHPVQAAWVDPRCRRFLGRRVTVVASEEYLSADDAHCFRSAVLQRWEAGLGRLRQQRWQVVGLHRGAMADVRAHALQELAKQFERLALLELARQSAGEQARLVDSLASAYLRRLRVLPAQDEVVHRALASYLNCACDRLWKVAIVIGSMARVVGASLRGLLRFGGTPARAWEGARYLWDAANPNELAAGQDRRSLFWLVDGNAVSVQDVVYLLPFGTSRIIAASLRRSPYRVAAGLMELYRALPRRVLVRNLVQALTALPSLVTQAFSGWEGALHARYRCTALLARPIQEQYRFQCYISSVSAIGHEPLVVDYFNAAGVPTVMYSYSANPYRFGRDTCRCDFRTVEYAHIAARHVVVWHQRLQRFFHAHPQDGAQFHALGPLMAGEDAVLRVAPAALLASYTPHSGTLSDGLVRVCVFDEAALTPSLRSARGLYPSHYTPTYSAAFLRDMVRLLEELKGVQLIFKPQRSFTKPKFSYADEFVSLTERLRRHPRAAVLPDDVNPWVPIALADICVGMPFTSPVLAGWHHGIPGFYHDPTGVCERHPYMGSPVLVTRNYAQLRSTVEHLLEKPAALTWVERGLREGMTDFIGDAPGARASVRFRLWLRQLSRAGHSATVLGNRTEVLTTAVCS